MSVDICPGEGQRTAAVVLTVAQMRLLAMTANVFLECHPGCCDSDDCSCSRLPNDEARMQCEQNQRWECEQITQAVASIYATGSNLLGRPWAHKSCAYEGNYAKVINAMAVAS